MNIHPLKPRKTLNKAFLKVKPNRADIELFKTNLAQLIKGTNDNESEEFHKNLIADFLKETYYKPNYFINTKGRTDLVIHNAEKAESTVGVVIETKKPTNKSEMLTKNHINVKAFHELMLYYLRERILNKNTEIKHIIATNINEWFVFDSNVFEKLFAENKKLVKQFEDFEAGRLSGTKTDFFYTQIAAPFVENITTDIEFTHFNIRDYEKPLLNDDQKDDNKLIALFKLLSPEHLLKLPFTNDSNSLDRRFYSELLHIIGLTERKEKGKKFIERAPEGNRNTGSILENAIIQLDSLDKISRLEKPSQFGDNLQERLFNVALELTITWINRVLFLKLMEGQLVTYHKGDKSYEFLHSDKITNYDDLNSLFFQVLARKHSERNEDIKHIFDKVPYLNSSLFEPTNIEHTTLFISNLRDDKKIPIHSQTVLKDSRGKKRSGKITTLAYLFEFLNAYDFASEGSEEIQEENKTIINASVLGLIFEKINGYKDGSFFTPGFITMYMARETIRKAVVQKFNDAKGWQCQNLDELYNKIDDAVEANTIINQLKICDPAVGSGHFLVSALNEILAIKHDLNILQDRNNRRLKEYNFEVVNDELIVTDEDGELFEYNPKSSESQRVQEVLFHEKQTIIENCLFGVDINPNSVKICRLRLWIELLKNAYYKTGTEELETLPNIDINIKCGNSLISRFPLDADLKQALKKSKWTIDSYRIAVDTYRNAENKEQKHEMQRLISDIKSNFRTEISQNDPKVQRLRKLSGEIYNLTNQGELFGLSKTEKKQWQQKMDKLTKEKTKLETQIEEIKSNKIYENAFEWRFEFPEVLDDNGDFIGFDVVIGNPPYKMIQPHNTSRGELSVIKKHFEIAEFKIDLFHLFYQLGLKILKKQFLLNFITPSSLLNNVYAEKLRKWIIEKAKIYRIAVAKEKVFEDAEVHTALYFLHKTDDNINYDVSITTDLRGLLNGKKKYNSIDIASFTSLPGSVWNLLINNYNKTVISKLTSSKCIPLKDLVKINRGLITGDRKKYFASEPLSEKYIPILTGSDIKKYTYNLPSEYVLFERPTSAGGCWDTGVHLAKHKICIRQIGQEPTAALIQSPIAVTGNIFTIIHQDIQIEKAILGLLNSKLIRYYWKIMFTDYKNAFPQITIFSLKEIPIVKSIIESPDKLCFLVDKKLNRTDFDKIEAQIDQLVYELYGLTEEEIQIVESGVQ